MTKTFFIKLKQRFNSTNVVSSATYLIFEQIFTVGAVFLINIYLANKLVIAEYGLFALLYTFHTLLSGMYNAVVIEPYLVLGSGDHKGDSGYKGLIARLNIKFFITTLIVLLSIAGFFWFRGNLEVAYNILGFSFATIFLNIATYYRRAFHIGNNERKSSLFSISVFSMMSIFIVTIHFLDMVSVFSAFFGLGISNLIACIVFTKRNKNKGTTIKKAKIIDPVHKLKHYDYAKWTFATAFIFQIMSQGYIWIMSITLTLADIGIFRAVQNIVLPINILMIAISYVFVPKMANAYANDSNKLISTIVRQYKIIIVIVCALFLVMILVAGEFALSLLYQDKYNDNLDILYILTIATIFSIISNLYNDILKAMKKPDKVFLGYMSAGLITIFFGIPLVIKYGLFGAAWGTALSALIFVITLSYSYYLLNKRFEKPAY